MITDVKSYLLAVLSRLGKAFSLEEFTTEDQLEFWELSAEYFSGRETPPFAHIVEWIDLLYEAPVHFVYKVEDEELVLYRQHVISKNILAQRNSTNIFQKATSKEKEFIKSFEYQLQNMQNEMEIDDVFKEQGTTSHSIGICEHIPLFRKNGDFWGVYCVGPFSKSPAAINPKLSIVGRVLTSWFISLEKEEGSPQIEYEKKIDSIVSNLGSGRLNTEAIVEVILRYAIHARNVNAGCVVEFTGNGHKVVSAIGLDEDTLSNYDVENQSEALYKVEQNALSVTPEGERVLTEFSREMESFYIQGKQHQAFLLLEKPGSKPAFPTADILPNINSTIAHILDYRYKNEKFSDQLTLSYYQMLRAIEQGREKTKFHTPRMVAFVERFGMFFGLKDDEMEIITLTAKMHDIGYVGAVSIASKRTIGSEITHPQIGANLVKQLSVHPDVVEGIKTHHEWINGEGALGLTSEEIPWTGKIINLFEYIVDFVETNAGDSSKTDEEWLELLSKGIMERADIQFDMVLVPTAIQLIQTLGWNGCVSLGTD